MNTNEDFIEDLYNMELVDYKFKNIVDITKYIDEKEEKNNVGRISNTGFKELDKKFKEKFLGDGEICLIGGRPGCGKLALATEVILNNLRDNHNVLFLDLRNDKYITDAILSNLSKIPLGDLMNKNLSIEEKVLLQDALNENKKELDNLNVFSDYYTPIDKIEALARIYNEQYNTDVIFINDYSKIRTLEGSITKSELDHLIITNRLLNVARELNLKIYIISDVDKQCEFREDKRAGLQDFYPTVGCLTDAATTILSIYRDEYYNYDTTYPGYIDITIYNARSTGMVRLQYKGEYCSLS